jgi:hypothetical protein
MPGDKQPEKISIEEALRRIRPLFILMMMFPLFGLVAAMVILYMLRPKNLLLLEAMIMISMAIYVGTTYLFARRIGQLAKKTKPNETPVKA